uniref:Uncharacterized protein TCIL3000_10_13350 n=1 Tax=Trypanosoma congolense (strain IL3000) TaxID=1068625 RepID=G0UYT5_TRYCI|nr:unnamed protein product [Trypanosoma congolense IL3000]
MTGKTSSRLKARRIRRPTGATTQNLFKRAISRFDEILHNTVQRHENHVFDARALFQMQRRKDREHFEKVYRDLEQKGDTAEAARLMEQYHMDEQKLYEENEEELQRVYPLAFLEDNAAAIVSLTLVPLLERKFASLEAYHTRRHKLVMSQQAIAAVEGIGKRTCVKTQLDAGTSQDSTDVFAPVKSEFDADQQDISVVGRGAYITPQAPLGGRGGGEEQRTCNALVGVGSQHQAQESTSSGTSTNILPELQNLRHPGEAELARISFNLSAASLDERRAEKERFLRGYMKSCDRCGMDSAEQELRRLRDEEMRDAKRKHEFLTALQLQISAMKSADSNVTITTSSGGEERLVDGGVNPGGRHDSGGERVPSGNVLLASTRRRVSVDEAFTEDVFNWNPIVLGDTESDTNSRMEAMAMSYMWPKHIEERIPHVLCGEVIPSYFSARQYHWGNTVPITEAGTGSDAPTSTDECVGCTARREGQNEATLQLVNKPPLVYRVPSRARKVWVKVNSLGDFVAGKLKVMSGSWPS